MYVLNNYTYNPNVIINVKRAKQQMILSKEWLLGLIITGVIGVFFTISVFVVKFLFKNFFDNIASSLKSIDEKLTKVSDELTKQNILVVELKGEKELLKQKVASQDGRILSAEEKLEKIFMNYLPALKFVSEHIDEIRRKIL